MLNSAKSWIWRGLDDKLDAEYTDPDAKELFATVKSEHEAWLAQKEAQPVPKDFKKVWAEVMMNHAWKKLEQDEKTAGEKAAVEEKAAPVPEIPVIAEKDLGGDFSYVKAAGYQTPVRLASGKTVYVSGKTVYVSGKTVYVSGYVRRDGTYVHPHMVPLPVWCRKGGRCRKGVRRRKGVRCRKEEVSHGSTRTNTEKLRKNSK